jgi:hypothetical protein
LQLLNEFFNDFGGSASDQLLSGSRHAHQFSPYELFYKALPEFVDQAKLLGI